MPREEKSLVERFSYYLKEYERVLRVARKPTREEFLLACKVAGLGIVIVGFIGLLITLIEQVIL